MFFQIPQPVLKIRCELAPQAVGTPFVNGKVVNLEPFLRSREILTYTP